MKRILPIALAGVLLAPAAASAQQEASAALAAEVVELMTSRGLDSFAAADPAAPGRFVAVLHNPGSQLLVISATHPYTYTLQQRIETGAFRDAYLDLQGTPQPDGKFFVLDARADGLVDAEEDSGDIDVVFQNNTKTFRFDGDPEGQNIAEAEYAKSLADAQQRYASALRVLKEALSTPAAEPAPVRAGV